MSLHGVWLGSNAQLPARMNRLVEAGSEGISLAGLHQEETGPNDQ